MPTGSVAHSVSAIQYGGLGRGHNLIPHSITHDCTAHLVIQHQREEGTALGSFYFCSDECPPLMLPFLTIFCDVLHNPHDKMYVW